MGCADGAGHEDLPGSETGLADVCSGQITVAVQEWAALVGTHRPAREVQPGNDWNQAMTAGNDHSHDVG